MEEKELNNSSKEEKTQNKEQNDFEVFKSLLSGKNPESSKKFLVVLVILLIILFSLAAVYLIFFSGLFKGSRANQPQMISSPSAQKEASPSANLTDKVEFLAVYTDDVNIILGDSEKNKAAALTNDGSYENNRYLTPKFYDKNSIIFVRQNSRTLKCSFETLDINSKKITKKFTIDCFTAYSIDISKDKSKILYLYNKDGQTPVLGQYDEQANQTKDLKTFPTYLGRGGGESDEMAVRLSPDEKKILAVITFLNTPPTLFVLNLSGDTLVSVPKFATFGNWSPSSDKVYYLGSDGLHMFDVIGKGTTKLLSNENALRIQVSPDGNKLAYEKQLNPDLGSFSNFEVWVYDLSSKANKKIISQRRLIKWLNNKLLLTVDLKPCSGKECSEVFEVDEGYVQADSSSITNLTDSQQIQVKFNGSGADILIK